MVPSVRKSHWFLFALEQDNDVNQVDYTFTSSTWMPVIGFQHHIRVAIAILTKLGSQYKFLYREHIVKHNKQNS